MQRAWVIMAAGLLSSSTLCAAQAQPGPSREHEYLKQLVGTWDATVKSLTGESKGTMVYRLELGGLWLVGNYQGDLGGRPFTGIGLNAYDPASKKYVNVWVDSMSTTPMVMAGDVDPATGIMTMTGEGRGMDGRSAGMKSVLKMEGKDAIQFTVYGVGPDGKETERIAIRYKRRR